MYLLIDAGNSRLKIACHDGRSWLLRCVINHAHELSEKLPPAFQVESIVIANVAGEKTQASLQNALATQTAPIEWLRSSSERCGLRCGYEPPAQLGPDRWAAAIGAWQAVKTDCLVVCAGTATTVDVVRAPGIFAGGCILPGLSLMLDTLTSRTAALPRAPTSLAAGALSTPPVNTQTAISAGCLHAQLGAIERMATQLSANSPILLAGGNAAMLAPHLGPRARLHSWLVMDGLLAIAEDKATK